MFQFIGPCLGTLVRFFRVLTKSSPRESCIRQQLAVLKRRRRHACLTVGPPYSTDPRCRAGRTAQIQQMETVLKGLCLSRPCSSKVCSWSAPTVPRNPGSLLPTHVGLPELMLLLTRWIQMPVQTNDSAQTTWTASAGERLAARTPRTMKINMATTCVPRNGGSDCVGARALSAGIFMKSWAIKTKTLR